MPTPFQAIKTDARSAAQSSALAQRGSGEKCDPIKATEIPTNAAAEVRTSLR